MQPSDFEHFSTWLAAKKRRSEGREPAPLTLTAYRARLSAFANRFDLQGAEVIGTLLERRGSVNSALDVLHSHLSTGSVRNIIYALVEYGAYLKAQGLCRAVTITREDAPQGCEPARHKLYDPGELDLLTSAARGKGLRWWAFVAYLVDTGRRVGETLSLEWSYFHLDESPAFVELPRTKNRKPNYVPLTRRLTGEVFTDSNMLTMKKDDSGQSLKLHRSPEVHPFPWSYSSVRGRMQVFCRDLGISNRMFHALRHTRATKLIADGVPIQAVSALLGHASIAQTDRTYNAATALSFARYVERDWNGNGSETS